MGTEQKKLLVIIAVLVIIVGVLGATTSYFSMNYTKSQDEYQTLSQNYTNLNKNYTTLNTTRNQLQVWLDGNKTLMQQQIQNLNTQIANLNSQIASLQSQIDSLKAAKLVKVNLLANDNRPWFVTPYLHVYGEVCNVGTNTAYNCKLHVVAYQGAVVAIDTYISLGSINGESWTSVASNVYYSGAALTSWTITPT